MFRRPRRVAHPLRFLPGFFSQAMTSAGGRPLLRNIPGVAHPLRSLQRVGVPDCRSLGFVSLHDARLRAWKDKSKSRVVQIWQSPLFAKAQRMGHPGLF